MSWTRKGIGDPHSRELQDLIKTTDSAGALKQERWGSL
jgi:hypothetical protein